jgi:hypothetical protein
MEIQKGLPKNVKTQPTKKKNPRKKKLTKVQQDKKFDERYKKFKNVVETSNYQRNAVQGRQITTVRQVNLVKYNKAEGDRANIMIVAPLQSNAVEFMPIALISNALGMGFANTALQPIYWAYSAFLSDLIAILGGKVSPVNSRLSYLNSILASMIPKTIPFKTGTLSFSWGGVDTITFLNFLTLRGYFYYLYVPTSALSPGGYIIQGPPVNPPTPDEAVMVLSNLNAQVADSRVPHLKYKTDINFTAAYKKDCSAFCQVAAYYGSGNSLASGAYASVELEVPFKSIVLTGLTQYDVTDGRLSRKFNLASGDTTGAVGLAFLPGFAMTVYNTKYPIQYCYIDLDEVMVAIQSWYITLVSKVFSNTTQSTELLDAMLPFVQTAELARNAFAQCIRGMFLHSQSMAQTMTYSANPQGFEPLRMGTNTIGRNRVQMKLPELIIENLRMLLPKFFNIPTQYENVKNQLVAVPVWGIYKANVEFAYNQTGLLYNGTSGLTNQPLFALNTGNDPNVIDGTDAFGNVCDLNSGNIAAFIEEWNERIDLLAVASSPIAYMGGNSDASLLLLTRFAAYQNIDVSLNEMSAFRRKHIPVTYIKRKKITRTGSIGKTRLNVLSKEMVEEEEERYIPPSGSLFTQITQSFSSLPAITEDYKLLTNYLIYPTIVIENNTPPTAKQARTGLVQGHILDYDISDNQFASSRGLKLQELGALCTPGQAGGELDELINVIDEMSKKAKGGFIGDILSTLARELPV